MLEPVAGSAAQGSGMRISSGRGQATRSATKHLGSYRRTHEVVRHLRARIGNIEGLIHAVHSD